MPINLYLALFTGIGRQVPCFEITGTPKELVNAHIPSKLFVNDSCKNTGKLYLAPLKDCLMKRIQLAVPLLVLILLGSCKNDDNGPEAEIVPPRLLSEVATEDEEELQEFLKSHFYNYEDFEEPIDPGFDMIVRIDTIAGENADKRSLWEDIQTESRVVESADYGLDDEEEIQHNLYYVVVREGVGGSPTFADNTVLRYEGSLLSGDAFDASNSPVNQYLSGNLIPGYAIGVEKLNAGEGPFDNGDGTVSFEDYGIGILFIPSGLGYFDRPPSGSGIPQYAPLIFKIDVLSFEPDTDFDGDGIPSILEDVDGDGDLNNDNTDADTEPFGVFLANHNDTDDDGDGIPTRDEIDIDEEGNVTFRDTDGDGIWDHLDNDE